MKKVIFISALAIAAAVSCTKSDIVDTKFNEQISFQTYTGRAAQTKAAVTDNDNISTKGVGLYGYYLGNAEGWVTTSAANLWKNAALTPAGDGTWAVANDPKYWANDADKYTFLAYSPSTTVATEGTYYVSTTDKGENPVINYTVDSDLSKQIDLLYAKAEGTAADFKTSGVALTMKHALSRLTVKAEATDENFKFDIKEITVTGNFRTTGTLPLSTGIWNEATVTDQIPYLFHRNGTVADNKVTYNPYIANNAITSVDYSAYTYYTPGATAQDSPVAKNVTNNYLMVIPSSVTMNVVVKYTTYYMNQESALITSDPIAVTLNLEKGKAYSITLKFSHEEKPIKFTVSVEDWTDAAGNKNQETNTDKDIIA